MAPRARGRTTNTGTSGGAPPGGILPGTTASGAVARGNKAKLRGRQRGRGNGAVTQHFSITRGSDGASVNPEQFIGGLVGWMQLNGICRTDAEARKAYQIGMQHVNTLIGNVSVL